MASIALRNKTGARGLRGILENVIQDIMFDAPSIADQSKQVVITADIVRQRFGC